MRFLLIIFIILINKPIFCHDSYWVFFKDKKGVNFDPYTYFDNKTIERRIKHGISLYDETDFPVNEKYISEVTYLVDNVDLTLRWFNAIVVDATIYQIEDVKKLPFVKDIIPFSNEIVLAEEKTNKGIKDLNQSEQDLLFWQLDRMDGNNFIKNDIDGKGVRVAIFDGGFPNYEIHPAFDHIRKDNRILNTWDFTKKNKNVSRGSSHGTATFSCVAGMYGENKIGLATGAEFLLAITEINSEPFKEEKWWLAAVEWADKNGADIISSSLGYINERYYPEEMDGHHSLVAKAARIAARKGILVVNAAGNEATIKSWQTIITPSDVDSVLCVGGINPNTNFHTSFSSFGPAADGTLKPNVSAYGHVIAASKKSFSKTQGTSFSCPLVSGFAACAWQINRDYNNMELFREIEKSGDLFPYFDYAHGYGIPQASYFTKMEKDTILPTFKFVKDENFIKVMALDDLNNSKKVLNDTLPDKINYIDYLYYNIQSKNGILKNYHVISVHDREVLKIEIGEPGNTLNVRYKGYSEFYKF